MSDDNEYTSLSELKWKQGWEDKRIWRSTRGCDKGHAPTCIVVCSEVAICALEVVEAQPPEPG